MNKIFCIQVINFAPHSNTSSSLFFSTKEKAKNYLLEMKEYFSTKHSITKVIDLKDEVRFIRGDCGYGSYYKIIEIEVL